MAYASDQRCAEDGATTCGLEADIRGTVASYNFNYGLAITSGGSWAGNRSTNLGCFYVTGARSLQPTVAGWDVGLSFLDTDGGTYSRM